ncbi:hypothetical protein BGW36DRAFT_445075 [Talaromyces proteolyticus]|uniref:Beta-glucuronidase C-terminal domain-containing protein n=1 Tax=Talaromyces proteolyticus TaxID=1131652 RepID=A0AAD4L1J5_9EURO|nr:uncharacterized protein BGW36DRAFT_445075 [Talaromyces proteolyticus]KAH8701534.1 hypothetical protein BGW36DRAFT_445075 [Talaromyces proteolyticus]
MVNLPKYAGIVAGHSMIVNAVTISYTVPSRVPVYATPLDCTPVGISWEFFMWPSYMTNITPPMQCVSRISDIYRKTTPIRVGGTTQDRATYDPNFHGYISYSVANPLDAPNTLIYGPAFWDLISAYGGGTMLGFNRGDDNRTNTYMAVQDARTRIPNNLWGIELGNEPDVYLMQDKPDAVSPWNASQEGADAANWAQGFINVWKPNSPILTAGSYAVAIADDPEWPNTDYLIHTAYNDTVKNAVKVYVGHLYAAPPGNTTLAMEMKHSKTVSDLAVFADRVSTAASAERPFILGETNFHPFDVEMDSTFGAAMVTLDKTLHAVTLGIKRLFYHQGTINQAMFNWWSSNQINAPFYGGYFSVLALSGGESIIELDSGDTSYAQYVIYSSGKPTKAVLVNTDYFSGSGLRSNCTVTLNGLPNREVKAIRMTAPSSDTGTSLVQNGANEPSIGGQYFSNTDCSSVGTLTHETTDVFQGQASFTVAASEALLLYL